MCERVNRFIRWLNDINQSFVNSHFELFAGIFICMWTGVYNELLDFGRQGNWAGNFCSC